MNEHQPADAVELMEREHRAILGLFQAYREAMVRGEAAIGRQVLADEICMALTIHMRLENEMLYPVLREQRPQRQEAGEGEAEHDHARALVARILRTAPDHASYDAQVAMLGRWVERHMQEEGEHLFPAIRVSGINLRGLADRLQERRRELQTVVEALREDALLPAVA
jgi:iron-sulfur cluster repair protein YtfE (RIC family)